MIQGIFLRLSIGLIINKMGTAEKSTDLASLINQYLLVLNPFLSVGYPNSNPLSNIPLLERDYWK